MWPCIDISSDRPTALMFDDILFIIRIWIICFWVSFSVCFIVWDTEKINTQCPKYSRFPTFGSILVDISKTTKHCQLMYFVLYPVFYLLVINSSNRDDASARPRQQGQPNKHRARPHTPRSSSYGWVRVGGGGLDVVAQPVTCQRAWEPKSQHDPLAGARARQAYGGAFPRQQCSSALTALSIKRLFAHI